MEITSPSGKVRETPLPEAAGLTVGRHASCDVRINADGVRSVHCRFLPDGDGYRVSAGPDGGLRVNGSEVTEKRLAEGDRIAVGPAKLTFRADRPAASTEESEELALVAASSDTLPAWADPARAKAAENDRKRRDAPPASAATPDAMPKSKNVSRRNSAAADDDAGLVSAAAQSAIFEEVDDADDPFDDGGDDPNPFAAAAEDADAGAEEDDDNGLGALAALAADETGETPAAEGEEGSADPAPAAADPDSGEQPVLLPPGGKLAPLTKLAGPPARPGEQSIFKSPLVLGLTALAATLTLAAFAFAFLTAREQAQRLYDAAVEARAAEKYSAALETYDQFLRDYPADALVPTVRRERGLTTIERAVEGSGGKWAEGVEAIETFVRENRDRDDFADSHPELAALSRRAALGAARQATAGGPRELLATVEEAQTLHRRYADPEAASTIDQSREVAAALRTAEAAVVKRETFGAARAEVTAALDRGDFAAAHRAREDLIARYRDLANDRDVRRLKADTLSAEREAVAPIPAADGPPPAPPATPAVLAPAVVSRAATGEASDGRSLLTRAGSSLFAVDAVTAEPLWRAPVGGAGGLAPFLPVNADAAGAAVLICDAVRPALLSVDRANGSVNWRLPLPAPATGPPRSAGGQALIGCADGSLLSVDPGSGAITGGLKFPRGVLSPPVAIGGTDDANPGRLLLAAEWDVVYTLVGNPPTVEAVSYVGQGAGAVAAPLQPIGRYVLMCDNDRADSALLRALAVDREDGGATEVGRARVQGRIDVPPELRADVLFVSSSPERMTAFAVTDEADKDVFSRLAAAQLPDPRPVPTYLAAGPDGALWAAGSALRKLELTGDGLQVTPAVLAVGRHVAPPQTNVDRLFTTRLTPAGDATVFAAAEADEMIGLSRTVLAPALLAVTGGARPAALSATGVLTPLGDGFPQAGAAGGTDGEGGNTTFLTNGRDLPGLGGDGRDPLLARRLPDGGVVVGVGGDRPRAWEIDADGRAGRPIDLPAAPQLAPLPLGPGLLIAVAPRLELAIGRSGAKVTAYTAPISGDEAPAWTAAVRLSDTKAVVTDAAGAIRVIQYADGSPASLTESAAITPEWFADLPPVPAGDGLIVVGSDGQLRRLNGATLGETASVALPAKPLFAPAVVGDRVLVALENGTVAGFAAADLTAQTSTPLPEPAAGPPGGLGNEGAAIVTAGGVAVRFDPVGGGETGRVETGQPLVGAPFLVGDQPAAAAADGAVVRLDFAPAGETVADRSEP
ncbi:PQQ-binding-like beta-propeller repeat protein [Alienimonas sp. DA493]|uniref:outer membrane protein assembly factor BamB family protein n=1 Tax=Alienimonas sp. DA493 TaxID=3373605 RepID=UPI00375426FA